MTPLEPKHYVITLLANPEKQALTQAFADSMTPTLALQDIRVEKQHWLCRDTACDLVVITENPLALSAFVQEALRDQPYDAVVQPVWGRRKKLLISDMDSTMITVECIDELADFVGKKDEVARITERAMNGELNFEAALTERVALLKGLPVMMLQECYDDRVKFMPGAKALVQTMRAHGANAVLVSGGFTFFTSRVREALGFHEDYANRLEVEHNALTGRVILPILGKEAKLKSLQDICHAMNIRTEDAMAVGDGANDLPMLMAAGMGVAYHAKPVVRAQANAQINHCDLSTLLWVQGFSSGEVNG